MRNYISLFFRHQQKSGFRLLWYLMVWGGMECGEKDAYIATGLIKKYISISKVAGIIFPAIHYLDEANEKICQWMKSHNASSAVWQ